MFTHLMYLGPVCYNSASLIKLNCLEKLFSKIALPITSYMTTREIGKRAMKNLFFQFHVSPFLCESIKRELYP